MATIECPGISAKWLKRMKTWFKGGVKEWYETQGPRIRTRLEHYVQHGYESYCDRPSSPYACWRGMYSLVLPTYLNAELRLLELEVKATTLREPSFDADLAVRAYASEYLSALIELYSGQSFIRIPGIALGIVLGCGDLAFQLARAAMRNDHDIFLAGIADDSYINDRPVETFMKIIVSDFFGDSLLPEGKFLADPILSGLLKGWRNPDPKTIESACLAICDYHTYGESFNPDELDYFPLEILLLFKLRQLLGLENPQLDHPIMNTPLGKLPAESPLQYDELIGRVRQRMLRAGFDEMVALGDNEWSELRKKGIRSVSKPDEAIGYETQALALAEPDDPNGPRVFNGLRSLAALHRIKGRNAEAATFYERALSIADRNPDCDPMLVVEDLTELYRDLGRAADAEAICRRHGFSPVPANVDENVESVAAKTQLNDSREAVAKADSCAANQPQDARNGELVSADAQNGSGSMSSIQEMVAGISKFVSLSCKNTRVCFAESPDHSLVIGLLAPTDAERDALQQDKLLLQRITSVAKKKCQEASRSFTSFVIESQETINRDHKGIRFPFMPEQSRT